MASFFCRSRPTVQWAATTAYSLGARRIAVTAGLGVHFEATTAGTSGAAEPAWDYTVGNTTADNTVVWTCRGSAADRAANTAYVAGDRVTATVAESAAEEGLVYECTTGGTSGAGATIAFSTTVGNTTSDNTVVWTTRACTTWNNAHIRLEGLTGDAASTIAAGDTIYVSHTHAQTSAAAVTILGSADAGTRLNPVKFLCVNDIGDPASPTTLATTGSVTTTGASAITISGASGSACYINGLIFNCGTGASAADLSVSSTGLNPTYENCAFNLVTTAASSEILTGTNALCSVKWINCTVSLGAVTQGIHLDDNSFEWYGSTASALSGSVPTTLFESYTGIHSKVLLHGLNLSTLNGNLFNVAVPMGDIQIYNCRFHANTVLTTGTNGGVGTSILMMNCDSGATNTNLQYVRGEGTMTDELTIVKSGGASDGTNSFSQKVVTVATLPRYEFPFISLPIVAWNDTTGSSKTATVEVVNDGVTLTDKDIWLEVEYLGNASYPLSSLVDDAAADILATAANQASSSVTWTTTGLTTPIKQKLEVTFTPQLKGPVIGRVYVARPSTTVYIDPVMTIT